MFRSCLFLVPASTPSYKLSHNRESIFLCIKAIYLYFFLLSATIAWAQPIQFNLPKLEPRIAANCSLFLQRLAAQNHGRPIETWQGLIATTIRDATQPYGYFMPTSTAIIKHMPQQIIVNLTIELGKPTLIQDVSLQTNPTNTQRIAGVGAN